MLLIMNHVFSISTAISFPASSNQVRLKTYPVPIYTGIIFSIQMTLQLAFRTARTEVFTNMCIGSGKEDLLIIFSSLETVPIDHITQTTELWDRYVCMLRKIDIVKC